MELLMKKNGIRLSDVENNVLNIQISDILEEVSTKDSYIWAVLFLDGNSKPGYEKFLTDYENKIKKSRSGIQFEYSKLISITDKYSQIFEITLLGSQNPSLLHRYNKENEMYNSCEIVIELIDCAFWEVYSKDSALINKLSKKFKSTELIDSDSIKY